jgi:hypothetical protein
MKSKLTEQDIMAEVKYVAKHLEELKKKQQTERQAYFDNPDNATYIAEARQCLAKAEQLYKAKKKAGRPQKELAVKLNVNQPITTKLVLDRERN